MSASLSLPPPFTQNAIHCTYLLICVGIAAGARQPITGHTAEEN